MPGNLQTAFDLVVAACNDPYIGYSQARRTTIKLNVNYRTYCDCSSLIAWALTGAGFFNQNPWFVTQTMGPILTNAGFTVYDPNTTIWQPGDILLNPTHHTEMCYRSTGTQGVTMGAHASDGRPFANEVSINSYVTSGSYWEQLWRYDDGQIVDHYNWTQVETENLNALASDQVYANAVRIYYVLYDYGFTDEAAAAVMGNIQSEGQFNPAQWEYGYHMAPSSGYGLFGYTPSTKYTVWAAQNGYDINVADSNGPGQLDYMNSHPAQWNDAGAGYSFDQFKQSSNERTAAVDWLIYWERAGTAHDPAEQQRRADQATYWLNEIRNNFPSNPGGNPTRLLWLPGAIKTLKDRKLLY